MAKIPTLSATNRLGITPRVTDETVEIDAYGHMLSEVRRGLSLAQLGRGAEYDRVMIASLRAAAAEADTSEVREALLKQVKQHEESLAKRES